MTPIAWVLGGVLYGTILMFFFNRSRKETIEETCALCYDSKKAPALLLAVLIGIYITFTISSGGTDWKVNAWIFFYYLIPTALLWHAREAGQSCTRWDTLAILSVWPPLMTHWWPERQHITRYDKPLALISVMIIGMVFWVGQRKITNTKVQFIYKRGDLAIAFREFAWMVPVLLGVGLLTNFLSVEQFQKNMAHFYTGKFVVSLMLIFINTPLYEEFFFRSIIQNFLEKRFGKNNWTLVGASIIFALEHVSQGTKSWNPLDWSWTYVTLAFIAGLGYGRVYRYTSVILYSVLIHCLVDGSWGLFKLPK